LQAVIERQAALIAKWQQVGFIHGVMNTDNMALSGETIDYGPCAFMDTYDPLTVFSSIDRQGRYAYGNQPAIAQWNLTRFAETLLPLLHPDQEEAMALGEAAIATFLERFDRYWLLGMRAKLGLFTQEADDVALIQGLLTWMQQNHQDYTLTFRTLSSDRVQAALFCQAKGLTGWYAQWQVRLTKQPESPDVVTRLMRAHNPAVIPRNHRVEEALEAAVEQSDLSIMQKLLKRLEHPYAELQAQDPDYGQPPEPKGIPYKTFCGT
jgi:uncharacterized protein YdiU (UPF0061 family)